MGYYSLVLRIDDQIITHMNLRIVRVHNASTPNEEYVTLQATADTNLFYYAVVDATFNEDGSVSNEHRHVYFFPGQSLKKDDWVVLSSGTGVNGTKGKFKSGTPYYEYFWQSKACIWNDGGDNASLIRYTNGNSVAVAPV